MKTFENGTLSESDGPPLEHEDWVEEQRRLQAEQDRERQRATRARAKSRTAAIRDEEDDEEEEPEFHGKPLSYFDGKSDEEITKIPGIADGTLAKIRAAQKSRAAKR